MPKVLWCANDIYMAKIGDDVVVLNLSADHYSCLLNATEIRHIGVDGAVICDNDDSRRALLELGLATTMPPAASRLPVITPRRHIQPVAVSRLDILRAMISLTAAALRFRGKPLHILTQREAGGGVRIEGADEPKIARLVGAARKARPWIPFEGACLKRSFQLRAYLAAMGMDPDWVFGVRTWPFSAHCWLQVGDLVLGDRLERVRRYTPIMRV